MQNVFSLEVIRFELAIGFLGFRRRIRSEFEIRSPFPYRTESLKENSLKNVGNSICQRRSDRSRFRHTRWREDSIRMPSIAETLN